VFPLATPITGNFYGITYSAVIDFQEKYRSEILTPAGLEHGSGYVGSYTRAKLNDLVQLNKLNKNYGKR